jgi:hypothetical protein
MLLSPPGSTTLDPAGGVLIGAPGTAALGGRRVDANGLFMDYDGQPQARPDVTTRGMLVLRPDGCVNARYYLDVFPTLDTSHQPRGQVTQAPLLPRRGCPALTVGGVPELQPGAAAAAGLPVARSPR